MEARYDDGVVMEAVVEKFVKYFKSIFHHNSWYFLYYVSCRSETPKSVLSRFELSLQCSVIRYGTN